VRHVSGDERMGPLMAIKTLGELAAKLKRFEPYFDQLEDFLSRLEQLQKELNLESGSMLDMLKDTLAKNLDGLMSDVAGVIDDISQIKESLAHMEKRLNNIESQIKTLMSPGAGKAEEVSPDVPVSNKPREEDDKG